MNCDEIKLTREMKRKSLNLFRMDDSSDPWGTGMGHMFAIADLVYHAEGCTPYEWEFRHGQFTHDPIAEYAEHAAEEDHIDCNCEWPDVEYVPFLDAGPLGVAMLTYAGDVLNRYLGFVKRAGRDY